MSTLVISDFSKTFTASTVPSTWSSIAKSGVLGIAYEAERNALYEANIAFEQAKNISKTNDWFRAHAELFIKYQLSESALHELVSNPAYYQPRA